MTKKLLQNTTLRTFITSIVTILVAFSLIITGIYFYVRSSKVLTDNYKNNLISQLKQINGHVEDQIRIIDSLFPLLITNPVIQDNLEPFISSPPPPESNFLQKESNYNSRLLIEKQMTQILISTDLWNKKYINSVSIVDRNDFLYQVSLYTQNTSKDRLAALFEKMPASCSSLEIKTIADNPYSFYLLRNMFSMYTGEKIGTIIIDINVKEWAESYLKNLDENWSVFLFNKELQLLGYNKEISNSDILSDFLARNNKEIILDEVTLDDMDYFIASKQLETSNVTSVVTVSKEHIFLDLNNTLKNYLTILLIIMVCTILFTASLSRTITRPIEKMIDYIRKVSKGSTKEAMPKYIYSEFNEFADAFTSMLHQLDIYYNDIYQKQILLKNAKIESLQAQMNPHFLFNVLNSIAWKAQISDNEEIYQMILSLSELLRGNILAKEKEFVTLEEELQYVKFYIYLQQMRFEDRFSITVQINPNCTKVMVPRFCIQPLVENAIVHGLEPRKGPGKLRINVIQQKDSLEIIVIDNGIGFPESYDINQPASSSNDNYTHIGLKNLNKRLSLLYNETCYLTIQSIPNKYTSVSFKIPY